MKLHIGTSESETKSLESESARENLNEGKKQHAVSGEVRDAETGTSLPGVNVVVKETTIGTMTNRNGQYALEAPAPTDTLVFSFVGYQPQEVPIENRSEIDVEMTPAVVGLDEVVVSVGYGEQTVQTSTGSVSQISGADLEVKPVTNLTNSLAGSIPGVIGVNSSSRPGDDDTDLLVRGMATLGNNSPLVVIDGVPARQGGLARLNSSDIENVSVLKDASAAIYGSRAANGVILVTTKRGREGPAEVAISVDQGFIQPTKTPEMVDAPTYMTMMNELDQYRGNSPRFTKEEIDAHADAVEIPGPGNHESEGETWEYHNTDWFAELVKPFSHRTNANLSVNGGSDRIRYYISLQGLTEDGVYYNSATRYNQFGFRTNLDGDINESITLRLDLHGRREDRNYPTLWQGAMWERAQLSKPTSPAYWPNGKPGPDVQQGVNPVVAATSETGYDNEDRYYFQSNLRLEAQIPSVDGLTIEGSVAYDQMSRERRFWQTPWAVYYWDYESYDEAGNPILSPTEVGVPEPRLSQEHEADRDITLQGTVNYEGSIGGNHNYSALVGTEYQRSNNAWFSAFRRYFASDQIEQLFAGGEAERDNDGNASRAAWLSYFTRLNYDYQQKYLLEFVGRVDGSYIFPEGDRFGFFPAVSVGWRLAQEEWFSEAVGFFDELKLRASWGLTGNDQIEPYQYLQTYQFGQGVVADGAVQPGLTAARVPNPNITWEVANQLDLGVQGGLLDYRLTFEVAYFRYMRDDILWWRGASVPQTAGFSLPRENIGKVASRGVDGNLSYAHEVSPSVSFRIGGNISYATDEIVYWAEAPGAPEWQRSTGAPMNTDLYYVADGVFNDQEEIDNNPSWPGARPGDIKFEDVNGDGVIDGDDRVRIDENGTPDLIGGMNLAATVHQFSASVQFQGATQVRQYLFRSLAGEIGTYWQEFAERRWTPENPEREHPRAYNREDPYWAANQNTYFYRDVSFLRLKNARIGYTLPSDLSSRFGIDEVQIYLSGHNLLTWSPMGIMDPETRDQLGGTYPPTRVYNVGLQVQF